MSTYWGFVCVSHDPPLFSEEWFNRGEATLRDAYGKERAGIWPVDDADPLGDPVPVEHRRYPTMAPIWWLRSHPHCRILLASEYGDLALPDEDTVVYGRVVRNARRPVRDAHGQPTGGWEPIPWPPEGERECVCEHPSSLLPETITPEPGHWYRCLCSGLREVATEPVS